ncbi:carbohydrate binding family 9 domain-containing protein [Roseateles koreensis]|uniref:Carbohydrate binding family 9 domain-containing protein n=1 Tax=Roseateles koreensis TaxID=2987526 RepID=A0ABT5KTE6_9BURK|nr:carbohydrate binding family 9 domain-containing protein [Roseateles koreensis]MDC8785618.1 carbohydrate binding family 9 domain-containing protein [Roseateles koreensis]
MNDRDGVRAWALVLALAFALCGAAPSVAAEGPRALRLAPGASTPVVDGRLDEPAWAEAPLFDQFVQFQPEDKKPAAWRTTVQVLVTADALIFGIRAYDPAPALIRAPLARRDRIGRDQDFVSVVIDPVGLRRSAQFVRISAAGVVSDGVFTADDDTEDFSPDFDVQAAAQRLPDGYSVELRWPLAALRFPHAGGAPWRLMIVRNIPRDEANTLVLSAPLTKEALNFIAELQPLGGLDDLVEQVRERSFLSVRPELTARRQQQTAPGLPTARQQTLNLGGELKWRPRADWVIDATLNPDFSQVELDAPQMAGNTRFALSVPEKRPFFLESSDIVGQTQADEEGLNHGLVAFYSRAITDPDWGLRATWRGASAEATALSLRDAGGGQILRAHAYNTDSHAQALASQASFARGRMQLGGASVGLLGALRDYGQGLNTRLLGSDFAWAASDVDLWRGHALLSAENLGFDAQDQALRGPTETGHHLWLAWRRRTEAWNTQVHLEEVSPHFVNDNGFVDQAGFQRVTLNVHRRLPSQTLAPLGEWSRFPTYELEWQLKLLQTQTLADASQAVPAGEVIERRVQPGFWLSSVRNTGVWGHLGLDQQRAHSGGPLHAPRTVTLGFESNPNDWLSFVSAEGEWGRRLDVDADRLGLGASFWVQARLRFPIPWGMGLDVEPQWSEGYVNGPDGRRSFTERTHQLLVVLHMGPLDSLRVITQAKDFQRRGEAVPVSLSADKFGNDNVSVVYQHRDGLSRVFSLGLSEAQATPGRQRNIELFAKAVWGWSR